MLKTGVTLMLGLLPRLAMALRVHSASSWARMDLSGYGFPVNEIEPWWVRKSGATKLALQKSPMRFLTTREGGVRTTIRG